MSLRRIILRQQFFARPTLIVTKDLLGKILVHQLPAGTRRYRITGIEAYCGAADLACHAAKGCTSRTKVMFGPAGHIYVYLIYGMYYCLNLVTANVGEGEAILVRAVEPLFTTDEWPVGPGRLCKYLNIDKHLNAAKLGQQSGLWVEDDELVVSPSQINVSSRRGVGYAGKSALKPWRFYLKDNRFVS